MSKRVYISADYSESNGDREVVDELHKWGNDALHKVDYIDTAEVVSAIVSLISAVADSLSESRYVSKTNFLLKSSYFLKICSRVATEVGIVLTAL